MRLIGEFDNHDYGDIKFVTRQAARAIIFNKNRVYFVQSKRHGEYKFPGGGVEVGETILESLVREVREEAGMVVKKDSIIEYGVFREKRRSILENEKDIGFQMDSYYFLCECEDEVFDPLPTLSEQIAGYHLVLESLDTAISTNETIDIPWAKRECFVMKVLKKEIEEKILTLK